MPQSLAGMTQYRIAQQELVTSAALSGDRATALQALLLDPMLRSIEDAESMLGELIDASSEYLPQFAQ
jgi:alpha-galactosidase/6-phospho-beta-glucosidase family protein